MASNWNIEFVKSARRTVRQLPGNLIEQAFRKILALGENPTPEGSIDLRGRRDLHRIRPPTQLPSGLPVSKSQRKIIVTRVRPRDAAYEGRFLIQPFPEAGLSSSFSSIVRGRLDKTTAPARDSPSEYLLPASGGKRRQSC